MFSLNIFDLHNWISFSIVDQYVTCQYATCYEVIMPFMQVMTEERQRLSWNVCKPVAILDKGHTPWQVFRSQCHQVGGYGRDGR